MSISKESCRQHYIRNNLCVLHWPNRAMLRIIESDLVFSFFCLRMLSVEQKPWRRCCFIVRQYYLRSHRTVNNFFLFSQFGCAIPIWFSYRNRFDSLKVYCFPLFYIPFYFGYIFNFPRIVWFYFILRSLTYIMLPPLPLQFSWIFSFILK